MPAVGTLTDTVAWPLSVGKAEQAASALGRLLALNPMRIKANRAILYRNLPVERLGDKSRVFILVNGPSHVYKTDYNITTIYQAKSNIKLLEFLGIVPELTIPAT